MLVAPSAKNGVVYMPCQANHDAARHVKYGSQVRIADHLCPQTDRCMLRGFRKGFGSRSTHPLRMEAATSPSRFQHVGYPPPRPLPKTQAIRRAWNLPDKRAVLASVANLMVCGVADIHPDFEGHLAQLSSMSRDDVTASKNSRRAGGGEKGEARGSEKERFDRSQ